MNYFYHGVWRMDWGLGNPNRTATLIACLMIAVWAIPLIWKRTFWPVLIVFTALAWCLVQTYSRGGMVAFLAGMGVFLFWLPRPWPRERWMAAVASLWILGGFVLYAKAQTRYGQGLFTEDQSIHSRLVVWSHAPEMMAAAPWGWGVGKAGDAYTQWFQTLGQSTNYLNLINSHLTCMVEWGWLASVAYLWTWLSIFVLCWPTKLVRARAVPLGIWGAFGVGACFSHVEGSLWLWIIPLAGLSYVILQRARVRCWPAASHFITSGAIAVGLVAILVGTGFATMSLPMSVDKGAVVMGRGSTKTVIFVDRQVMGAFFGHTFRKYLEKNPRELSSNTFILTESVNGLPSTAISRLVISGKFTEGNALLGAQVKNGQIIWVNPAGFPAESDFGKDKIDSACVYFGEYSQASPRSLWTTLPGIKAFQIDGAGDFVPGWPQAILAPRKT
jgi:hypothetical protein